MKKDMPKSAIRWYKMWLALFPESLDGSTLEMFYMFVDVLLTHTRKERSWGWLAENLKEECTKLTQEDIEEYCDLYDHLKGFKNVWKGQLAKQIASSIYEEQLEEARKKYGK